MPTKPPLIPTNFDRAVQIVMGPNIEGGHSYDVAGGDTWFGIARNFHRSEDPWPPTKERAVQIYKEEYWDRYRCGSLPKHIGIALFDAVVNQPPDVAIQLLQRALGVAQDGVIGPETVAAANHADDGEVTALFFADRALRYSTVSLPKYRRGLIARLFRIQAAILNSRQA